MVLQAVDRTLCFSSPFRFRVKMKTYAVLSTFFCSIELTKWGRLGGMREVKNPSSKTERQQRTAALMETVQSDISYVFVKYVVSNLVLFQHLNQKILPWVVLRQFCLCPHQSLLKKQNFYHCIKDQNIALTLTLWKKAVSSFCLK